MKGSWKEGPHASVASLGESDKLAQETERRLLYSETVEQARAAALPVRPLAGMPMTSPAENAGAQRVFIDVSPSLRPDAADREASRIQRHMVEHLARDPALSLDFVVRERGTYRLASRKEDDDRATATTAAEPPQRTGNILGVLMARLRRRSTSTPAADQEAAPSHDSPFRSGDVLLCTAGFQGDMDYAGLARLGAETGVRIVGVLHDVARLALPHLVPEPADRLHRHCVEIGHASECLIVPSQFSAECYDRLVARPNDIDVPVHVAPLPNLLRARADEVEDRPVPELEGYPFVLYRAPIEARENHMLALNLWDELRERLPPEAVPLLVLAGDWGWGVESVQRLIESNRRLRPHVRVLPGLSDAEAIWLQRNARFCIFPSLVEDSGHLAAESLAFGTPVVVSTCPSLLEATEGLMPSFHPHDFPGWLHELERLIVDDSQLAALRQAAPRYRGPAREAFVARIREVIATPAARRSAT
jgi:glycosyltransferase involved in cell wall biosynthesis